MNAFLALRRILWSILLAACITVVTLYVSLSQVFLSTTTLQQIAVRSNIADTLRNDVLLPKIVNSAAQSQYASLLDKETITRAFNRAVPENVLVQKMSPAISALQSWLDSKEPDITFTIDTADISTQFADELAKEARTKIASLPRCTLQNSLSDAENGVCRSGFISPDTLATVITTAIKNDMTAISASITPDDIPVPDRVQQVGQDIPTYLNILYASSIISAGIAVVITLWLLIRHRLSGLIAIGGALMTAGVVLYGLSFVVTQNAATFATNTVSSQIINTTAIIVKESIQNFALPLFIGGAAVIILLSVLKIVILRRGKTTTAHVSDHAH